MFFAHAACLSLHLSCLACFHYFMANFNSSVVSPIASDSLLCIQLTPGNELLLIRPRGGEVAGWAGGQISWANKRRKSSRHAAHKLGLLHKSPRTLQVRSVARLVGNLLNAEIGESERAFYCIITQFGANKAAKQN